MEARDSQGILLEVSGKPAFASFGVVAPSSFGKTTLQLSKTRVIERSKRIIARRYVEVLLSKVDSVEITEEGNPLWIGLGIVTLGFFGIGIIFFIVYFFQKRKYLIVRSGSNVQLLVISGSDGMEKCGKFMSEVLRGAEEKNKN